MMICLIAVNTYNSQRSLKISYLQDPINPLPVRVEPAFRAGKFNEIHGCRQFGFTEFGKMTLY
jgi:hypothetical protein